MVSVIFDLVVSTAIVRLRSDRARGHIIMSGHGLAVVCLFLALLLGDSSCTLSLNLSVKCSPDKIIEYPKRRTVCGRKKIENILFTKGLIGIFACINTFVFLLLLISGDVHPNPGPDSFSSSNTSTCSNMSTIISKNLNIIHLNIQSILPKIGLLEVEMQNYDILIFTETWLTSQVSDDDIMITNFNCPYRKDREGRQGGGVAIYTKIGISSVNRPEFLYDNLEALCIEIKLQSHKFLLCGLYRPPNSGLEYWDLIDQSIDNMSTSTIKDLVIMGDFNCDMLKNDASNKITQLALSYNLQQLIEEPTHYTEHSASLIDLALVSKPSNVIYSDVTSPFIPDLIRYHCPIILVLKFRKPSKTTHKRHIWLYDKGDYTKYRRLLNDTDWNQILLTPDLNETVNKVTDVIIESAKAAIPNKTVIIRPEEPKWINCNIKRQIRQRKRLFKIAKRRNNAITWTKFRQKRNAVTTLIRNAKQKYNEKLASDLKDSTLNSKSWYKITSNLLNPNSETQSIPFLETDDMLAETNTEISEVLNSYFTEQATIDDSNATLPNVVAPEYPFLESIYISDEDVKDSISLLKTNKAPGPDSISPKLIKEGASQLISPLRKLFNKSLRLQHFPDSWKDANVIPIHKKDNFTKPCNYRPISLLSYLGKLMERCIHKHISNYLKQNNVITHFQSGFQSGDSTINQLVYLNNTFLNALDKGKEIRIVFCDVSKAFDRVWHKGLLFKLKSIGLSGDILEWFSSYLNTRRQRVCYKGTSSSWMHINAGVPQGSILGPTLFLIFINDIVKNIRTNIRLFADDTSLFKIVDCPINAAMELNIDLRYIYRWARKWLVDFNAAKTVSLIISKKRLKPNHPELFMANSSIKEVNQHKHLGLIFSSDATWTNHIKVISVKAWKRIGYLRRLRFLLDRPSLQKIYTTFIRPLLEYGNIIWDSCTLENKRTIENIQLEAARLVTGGTKLCSFQKLYDDTKWETLQKRRSKQKLYQLYKMINGLVPDYLQQLVPYRVMQLNRYPVRNSLNFSIPISRTVTYSASFLPSTLRDWNALTQDIKNAPSLSSFKYKLNNPKRYPPMYFDNMQLSRIGQVLHARLRLECSSLKHHLYQKNLVDSPFCSCGQIESPTHFLLHCPNYIHQRQQYLSVLPYQLNVSILLNGISGENVTVNEIIFKHVQLYIVATKRFA